jgi:histidyl-tRNA synthetase
VIGLPGDLGTGGLTTEGTEGTEAKAWMDAECAECCVSLLRDVGLDAHSMNLRTNDRRFIDYMLDRCLPTGSARDPIYALLDRRAKMSAEAFAAESAKLGFMPERYDIEAQLQRSAFQLAIAGVEQGSGYTEEEAIHAMKQSPMRVLALFARNARIGEWANWLQYDPSIVRGLAYYTGTVFEVLADGERAIAGGGRYDKLIELMGGPPTPAVGFAMGDVVVSLLLEDKGLMPQGAELMEAVSRVPASVRPEVFVVSGAGADTAAEDSAKLDAAVRRLSADLRRGVEADAYKQAGERKPWSVGRYDAASGGVRPVHARVSYKSTRNLKKLLADGEKQFARYAAVVHGPDRVQLKDFDGRRDLTPRDVGLSDAHAEFSVDPASPVYVGRAVR